MFISRPQMFVYRQSNLVYIQGQKRNTACRCGEKGANKLVKNEAVLITVTGFRQEEAQGSSTSSRVKNGATAAQTDRSSEL